MLKPTVLVNSLICIEAAHWVWQIEFLELPMPNWYDRSIAGDVPRFTAEFTAHIRNEIQWLLGKALQDKRI